MQICFQYVRTHGACIYIIILISVFFFVLFLLLFRVCFITAHILKWRMTWVGTVKLYHMQVRKKRRKSFMWLFDSRIKIGKVFIVILCDFPNRITSLGMELVTNEWGLLLLHKYFKLHDIKNQLSFSLCCNVCKAKNLMDFIHSRIFLTEYSWNACKGGNQAHGFKQTNPIGIGANVRFQMNFTVYWYWDTLIYTTRCSWHCFDIFFFFHFATKLTQITILSNSIEIKGRMLVKRAFVRKILWCRHIVICIWSNRLSFYSFIKQCESVTIIFIHTKTYTHTQKTVVEIIKKKTQEFHFDIILRGVFYCYRIANHKRKCKHTMSAAFHLLFHLLMLLFSFVTTFPYKVYLVTRLHIHNYTVNAFMWGFVFFLLSVFYFFFEET